MGDRANQTNRAGVAREPPAGSDHRLSARRGRPLSRVRARHRRRCHQYRFGRTRRVGRGRAAAHLHGAGQSRQLSAPAGGPGLDGATERLLRGLGPGPFVFNLGHGVLPDTPPEHVARIADSGSNVPTGRPVMDDRIRMTLEEARHLVEDVLDDTASVRPTLTLSPTSSWRANATTADRTASIACCQGHHQCR